MAMFRIYWGNIPVSGGGDVSGTGTSSNAATVAGIGKSLHSGIGNSVNIAVVLGVSGNTSSGTGSSANIAIVNGIGIGTVIVRPTSDISVGAWTSSLGGALYLAVDESTVDDGDYITTSSASNAEVKFGTTSTPTSDNFHIIRFRAKGTGSLEVRLYQGGTLIATFNPSITGSYQTFTWELSEGQAASITDYSDLRIRFMGS